MSSITDLSCPLGLCNNIIFHDENHLKNRKEPTKTHNISGDFFDFLFGNVYLPMLPNRNVNNKTKKNRKEKS